MEKRVFCPISECGRAFYSNEDLEKHLSRRHDNANIERVDTEEISTEVKEKVFKLIHKKPEQELGLVALEPPPNGTLTAEYLLDITGEDALEDISSLLLRDKQLVAFESNSALDMADLLSLEVLSLSHNKIRRIDGVAELLGLLELNINSNEVSDLAPVSNLKILRKLFCSNNLVKSILPLKGLKNLVSLSISNNKLFDLSSTIKILVELPRLTTLDIDRNPCMLEVENSRFKIIKNLKLEFLDDEVLTPADFEIANDLVKEEPPVPRNFVGKLRTITAKETLSEKDRLHKEIEDLKKELKVVKAERDELLEASSVVREPASEEIVEENTRLKREISTMYVLLDEVNSLRDTLKRNMGDVTAEVYEENARLRARMIQLENMKTKERPATARPKGTAREIQDLQIRTMLQQNQSMLDALDKKLKDYKNDIGA